MSFDHIRVHMSMKEVRTKENKKHFDHISEHQLVESLDFYHIQKCKFEGGIS